MSRIRLFTLALAGLLAGLAGLGSTEVSGSRTKKSCKEPREARTVLLSKEARVWRRQGRTYVCPKATGRAVHLGDEDEDTSFPTTITAHNLRLNRRFLAYALEISREETLTSIRLFDLHTGRIARRIYPEAEDGTPRPGAAQGVTDLELARDGSVAWIVQNSRADPPRTEVGKLDRAGRALLDAGPAIDTRSLALADERIYWTNAETPRSAALDD